MAFADDGSWTPSGCRDCDSTTGGACWRHAMKVFVVGTLTPIASPPVFTPPVVLPFDRFNWPPPA